MNRGDVYRVNVGEKRGHAQAGARYAVIVQADEFLPLSTAIVAPTSQSAPARTFRPVVDVRGQKTRVLVEQLRAIDVEALTERVSHLDAREQMAVDEALSLVLGL